MLANGSGLIQILKCLLEFQYSAYPDQMEAIMVYQSVSKIDSEDHYLASAFDLNLLDAQNNSSVDYLQHCLVSFSMSKIFICGLSPALSCISDISACLCIICKFGDCTNCLEWYKLGPPGTPPCIDCCIPCNCHGLINSPTDGDCIEWWKAFGSQYSLHLRMYLLHLLRQLRMLCRTLQKLLLRRRWL